MDTTPPIDDEVSALEKARRRLYTPVSDAPKEASVRETMRSFPHVWKDTLLPSNLQGGERHVRLATIFFAVAVLFFIVALSVAGFSFYLGGNSLSIDKVSFDIQGPTTITGGDTVPLSLIITNRNPVALKNAVLEIDFPNGTRSATNIVEPYPRYSEKIDTLESGATITRSIKAVMFGGSGQELTIPIRFSFGAPGSLAIFEKKTSYAVTVTTTPLEVSVSTLTETVSNKPITFTITVRSNATIPLPNVVLAGSFPFGFTPTSSSLPLSNSSFLLGTLAPGATKTVTLTGTLTGQNNEERVFHFTVGTANAANNQTLAVTYMTQDASILITAPFIDTTLAINGKTETTTLTPGTPQNVSVSYTNTLATAVQNATVAVQLSGSAIDYDTVRSSSGFYDSRTRTILFSKDTDPALATLAPGASGIGAFTFSTLPASSIGASPNVTFTVSVSGTRIGQSNVPEEIQATMTKTAKVVTSILFTALSSRTSGGLAQSGPIPPRAGEATTYSVVWTAQNKGSPVAGGTVTATLPSYVTYTGLTSGTGSLSYNESSRTVTWTVGDVGQGATAQAAFQVSLTPSTSQKGSAPALTSSATFSGYDRFAGVPVSVTLDPINTETKSDPGYTSSQAAVQ